MSDEIKEILQMLEAMASNDDIAFLPKQASLLLDYITNLQDRIKELEAINEEHRKINGKLREENEILKKNAEHNDKVVDKARWNEMVYKSRIDKAIEYCENNKEYTPRLIDIIDILKGDKNEK